ncbi:U6 snRNA phosphodiesterase-like protein [Carex rostrata]
MEALRASYGSDSDESDGSPSTSPIRSNGEDSKRAVKTEASDLLPPPPLDLLQPPNYIDYSSLTQGNRARSFPHVEGIYALHIYIPVYIPATARRLMVQTIKKVSSVVPSLYAVDTDFALNELCKDDCKLEKVLLSREFHISLGRTVGIQVDQIDSIVAMLRTKLHSQRQYWIEFDKWEVFVNDDSTRSFLSLEITGTGLQEITQQINVVDEVYRLHGLPEFYKDPRPHISLLWGPGDIRNNLMQAVVQIDRSRNSTGSSQGYNFKCKFSSIVCKVGKKSYDICKI